MRVIGLSIFSVKRIAGALAWTALFLSAASALFAAPFSEQWEWESPVLLGSVRKITTTSTLEVRVAHHNALGQKTAEVLADPAGRPLARWSLHYSADGLLERVVRLDPAGLELWEEKAERDGDGRLIRLQRRGEAGWGEFKHDDRGRVDEIRLAGPDGKAVSTFRYGRDESGQATSIVILDLTGKQRERSRLRHDKRGHLIEAHVYGHDDRLIKWIRHEYELDQTGNWTRRRTTETVFGAAGEKTEWALEARRIIEYYAAGPSGEGAEDKGNEGTTR
jgi:hypothetical protein